MARGERFPKAARLRRGGDIRGAFRRGRRVRRDGLDVYSAPSTAEPPRPRFGAVVPLHGRSSAERNRLRRRLREVARRDWLPGALEAGDARDVVVRVRPSAYGRGFRELRRDLLDALSCSDG